MESEKKKVTKNRIEALIVIIGAIIIPLLYSYFYLDAFWDPYSKLDKLPVAVVNQDKGAQVNGKEQNYGDQLCKELKDSGVLKFEFTDEEKAYAGVVGNVTEKDIETGQVNPRKYYAMLLIPEDFSDSIASGSRPEKTKAIIKYTSNEKRNYLATQILSKVVVEVEQKLTSQINGEIVTTLSAKLEEVPKQLATLNTGLGKLQQGSQQLVSGTEQLSQGVNKLKSGGDLLSQKMGQLQQGISSANTGSQNLYSGLQTLNTGLTQLDQAATQINQMVAVLPDAEFGALKGALTQLGAGITQAKTGGAQLQTGAAALQTGLGQLNTGAAQLGPAGTQLTNGINQLQSGINQVNAGAKKLESGITTAKDGVSKSETEANSQLPVLNGLNTFAEKPIEVKDKVIEPVPNYGTAFAPYFMSLSLWVGALIIFFGIYFDPNVRFKTLGRNSDRVILRSFAYLLIGFLQAIVLVIVLVWGLGLKVNDLFWFFVACCLISMVFIAIVQFLIVYLKDFGKFLSILLLILQLTSCAGTFPMETVPKLFNVLYPFMPMSYSVGLLKEVISGTDPSAYVGNSLVLLAILVVFMVLSVVFAIIRKRKAQRGNTTPPSVNNEQLQSS